MQNVFIIFTPKMMNSPRRSDASWTALSWLRGWMATFVSWPYMRLWIFTCILWFDCPHPIYAPFKCFFESNANLEWMGLHCFPIPEILANHLFSKFHKVHKKCFTCAKLIISCRNQGCLAASTFIQVATGLPNVLIIKAPSFANGDIILLLCPLGSLHSSFSFSPLFVWFLPLPPLPSQPL